MSVMVSDKTGAGGKRFLQFDTLNKSIPYLHENIIILRLVFFFLRVNEIECVI